MVKSEEHEARSSGGAGVSRGEERFEFWRKRAGLFLAPAVFAMLWFANFEGLEAPAHRLFAVFGLVITLWVTEAIPLPVTALLGPALCVVCGVTTEKEIFRSFGNPILFLFLGSFLLAEAMLRHGLNRRIAFTVLGVRWVARSPARVLTAFGVATALLSMWTSNTASAAMMFPIALAILSEAARSKSESTGREVSIARLNYSAGLMLMTAFAASIGGMATPVGTPPNLIGMGFIEDTLNREITFFQWMMFGVPLAILILAFLAFYLNRVCPAEPGLLRNSMDTVRQQKAQLGPLTRGEKNVLAAFLVTVLLWLLPGAAATVAGVKSPVYTWLNTHFPEGVCALLGASLLFLLPVDWKRSQ